MSKLKVQKRYDDGRIRKDISISDIIIKNTSTPLLYQIVTHFQPNHNRTKVKRTEKKGRGL